LHQKQQIIAGLESQKQAMVAALWSNSNYDDDKNTRSKAIRDIELSYSDAIEAVEHALGAAPVTEEQKLSESNEFFAAAERGLQKIERRVMEHRKKTGNQSEYKEERDFSESIDQS
jgi:hypothetical protein